MFSKTACVKFTLLIHNIPIYVLCCIGRICCIRVLGGTKFDPKSAAGGPNSILRTGLLRPFNEKFFTFGYGQGRILQIYHPSIIVSSVIILRRNRRRLHFEKIFVPSEWCWHLTRNFSPASLPPDPCFISVLRKYHLI